MSLLQNEIKSPPNTLRDSKDSLSFVQNAMKSAKSNFSNPYDYEKKDGMGEVIDRRVVLNLKYKSRNWDGKEFEKRLMNEMREYGIKEVMCISDDGSIRRYKNG